MGMLAEEFSREEGGQEIDILCPECREQIKGTYLPTFECPHCQVLICVDQDGELLFHQGEEQTCPECGHTFRAVADDQSATDFQKFSRKVEDFFLRLLK